MYWTHKLGTVILLLLIVYILWLVYYFYNTLTVMNKMYSDVHNNKMDIEYRTLEIFDKIEENNLNK